METSPSTLTTADWALIRLLAGREEVVSPEFWRSFRADWGDRLRLAWDSATTENGESTLNELRLEHAEQARPDLQRVHPSWFIRGLQGESPSVQRVIVARASPSIRETLRVGLGLSHEDLEADRAPHEHALRWALALWTERLVADRPERVDDDLSIVALTRLRARQTFRIVRAAGLAKWAMAGEAPPAVRGRERERFDEFERLFRSSAPGLRQWAGRDLAGLDRSKPHPLARLGMVTIARLLDEAEPHRVRWALQHVPYPVAKLMRSLMSTRPKRDPALFRCETEILRIAWDGLRQHGRLPRDSGGALEHRRAE